MEKNKSYEELFAEFDKTDAFDRIAELFYNKNFSSASKSEIELLMFDFYMKALIKKYKDDETGIIDYNTCSDYRIAKDLGITQEKVRNLKIKKEARYPEDYDWKKSLLSLKEFVRYDENSQKIIIPMPDPNLYLEIKNSIEENGGYIEVRRSGNYLQIRPEYYVILIYDTSNEKEKEKLIKEVVKVLNKKNPNSVPNLKNRNEMINHILGITENSLSILASLVEYIDNPVAKALTNIVVKFREIEEKTNG